MDADSRGRSAIRVKAEDDSGDIRMADDKPSYRSWKKKYRKMRIVFDQKMHEGEELHRLEQKALATAKRLAIQKDRLLDLLLDVNNSAQIPPEKRIDLSLDPPSDPDALFLDIDRPSTPPPGPTPLVSYKKLRQEVPHSTFASATERFPELVADLEAGRDSPADPARGQSNPPSFLTADDLDNYIWEVDARLAHHQENNSNPDGNDTGPATLLPTLAPAAHAERPSARDTHRDFAVRNPTSVYNWLRKHAPKTFLQDGEHDSKDGGGKENGDDAAAHGLGSGRRGGKGERGPRGGAGAARNKRVSVAHSRAAVAPAAAGEALEEPDEEAGYGGGGGGGGGAVTPGALGSGGPGSGKGKRKRVVDDDPGYRPKGGSSRPAKKKRKSEGLEGTPMAKARKSTSNRSDMRGSKEVDD
ncbi:hypothetical protein BT67DRAFT_423151 [Trichocladium antarcticum]|uniref:Uncharacterized protein n=1 Tax=Trichocladium antarcticum TaxID=1450529 RepID=A0AAN6ZDG6_9PEZI|nr:hypothetical protein BT67DRAFT_423151 [Trichocladium antarcticum]